MRAKLAGLALVLAALVGCTLTRHETRQGDLIPVIGRSGVGEDGRVVVPKRCALKVIIASRPAGDAALDGVLWRAADEQAVEPEVRRVLAANGLRVGRIAGELPAEVREVLDAPPPHKLEPKVVVLPDGEPTLIDPGPPAPHKQMSLFLDHDGKVGGKDFADAKGFLRLTARYDGPNGVALRVVPEVHHGPVRQGWAAAPTSGPLAPRELMMTSGQQEDSFRDLAAALVLQPGQVAVIGCRGDRPKSLGDVLLSEVEANSDRPVHKVVFLWASRAGSGVSSPADAPPEGPPAGLIPVEPPAPEPKAAGPAS